SYGVGYGIKDPRTLDAGKVYEYRFDVDEIRAPIIETVKANGWEWVPVTAKRHVVSKTHLPSPSFGKQKTAVSCLKCGAPLRSGAKFCTSCGEALSTSGAISKTGETKKRRRWFPFFLLGSGLLVMILVVILVADRDKGIDPIKPEAETAVPKPEGPASELVAGWQTEQKQPTPVVQPTASRADSDRFNEEGIEKAQKGQLSEAVDLFTRSVNANPDNHKAWNNLGLSFRKLGKTDEAIKAYRQALQAQPSFALAYKNLGVALEQSGDKTGAAQAYEKYCQLDPTAPDKSSVQARADQLLKEGENR
ncbi:MAG: hypothetical protein ACD_74C00066G0003, partial [uncultured bacterium]